MAFWLFCSAMVLLTPAVMLGFGLRFWKRPPEKINRLFGYRTSRSMRDQETWAYAHHICGKLWVPTGVVMAVLGMIPMMVALGQSVDLVGTVCTVIVLVQAGVLCLTLIPVEYALKKRFDGKSGDQGA